MIDEHCINNAFDCSTFNPADTDVCFHCKDILILLCRSENDYDWNAVVNCMATVRKLAESSECGAAAGVLIGIMQSLVARVDAAVSTVQTIDLRVIQHVRSAQKRCRLDSDFTEHMATTLIKQKRVHNCAQFIRAATDLSDSSGRDWEKNAVCSLMAAQMRTFNCLGVCGHSEDSARNGRPAEDTCVHLFWDAKSGYGGILPFQV